LTVFPLITSAGGKNPSSFSQSETKSLDVTPVIASPSMGDQVAMQHHPELSCILQEKNENVCVFVLHLLTNAAIRW